MKNKLAILSVVVGVTTYTYQVVKIAMGNGEGFSFSTFALWSALAWISGFTMLKQGSNPSVPMIYGAGASATTLVLLFKGRFHEWSVLDSVISIMVIGCVILWFTKGAKWALVLSVVAAVIAAIPFTIMIWTSPEKSPVISNAGFFTANALSFLSAKTWKMEDRLYSGVNTVVCFVFVLPWLIFYVKN